METLLKIEYGLINFQLAKKESQYYIRTENNRYILEETSLTEALIQLINNSKRFYQVIKNKNNLYITTINEKHFILYKIDQNNIKNDLIYINKNGYVDWRMLWGKKIDLLKNNRTKLPNELLEIMDYYIGIAENSIVYWNSIESKKNNCIVSRKRMDDKNQYNPNNAIIDFPEREFAEKIKNDFFEKENSQEQILEEVNQLQKKRSNIELIMCRLLFPTYYFDIVEDYLENGKADERKIKKIRAKQTEYEKLLNIIQNKYLNKKEKIKWI